MESSIRQFELRQASEIFPKPIWPYFIVLVFAYYIAVVFEFHLLFTSAVALILLFLLLRSNAASRCVLTADSEKLAVEYTKGLFGVSVLTREYFWKEMESFQWKSNGPELQLNWKIWEDCYYFGKDLEAFLDYLRTHFPEKEQAR